MNRKFLNSTTKDFQLNIFTIEKQAFKIVRNQ